MNVFAIVVAVVIAYVALKLFFGVAGGLIGLLLGLAFFALKVLVFAGLAYWVLTLVSPDTAKKVRDRVKGPQAS